jgi:hypothetical protein
MLQKLAQQKLHRVQQTEREHASTGKDARKQRTSSELENEKFTESKT